MKAEKNDGFTTFVFTSTDIQEKTVDELKDELQKELAKDKAVA